MLKDCAGLTLSLIRNKDFLIFSIQEDLNRNFPTYFDLLKSDVLEALQMGVEPETKV